MKMQCPHCGVKGSADDSYHGRTVRCPKCKGAFIAQPEEVVAPQEDLLSGQETLSAIDALQIDEDKRPAEAGEVTAAVRENLIPDEVANSDDEPAKIAESVVADEKLGQPLETIDSSSHDVITSDSLALDEEVHLEDITDDLALADITALEPLESNKNVDNKPAPEEVIAWSDIALEIDRELEQSATSESKKEADESATFQDLFADALPADELAVMPVAQEPLELMEGSTVNNTVEESVLSERPEDFQHAELEPAHSESLQTEVTEAVESAIERCSYCGKEDVEGVPMIAASDGKIYCPNCLPEAKSFPEVPEESERNLAAISDSVVVTPAAAGGITISGILKEAWAKTKGAKGAIWAGTAIMYLAILIIAAGVSILPGQQPSNGGPGLGSILINSLISPAIMNIVSVIFSAGLLVIGIRRVEEKTISWRMALDGFSVAGKLIVVALLQFILISIGFLLLILPGIYLSIGYAMAVPLVIDRKMAPWQAMETSRKAIHRHWWKFFGLFLVMGLIMLLSSIPLGLGIIWTWPMFVVLGGVVYRTLFGIADQP